VFGPNVVLIATSIASRPLARQGEERSRSERKFEGAITKTKKPAVAHASGLRGGAAALFSSRHLGLLPGGRNSKIVASATAIIRRRAKTVKYGSVLSPLSTDRGLEGGRRNTWLGKSRRPRQEGTSQSFPPMRRSGRARKQLSPGTTYRACDLSQRGGRGALLTVDEI
jgi:hypothetical protein